MGESLAIIAVILVMDGMFLRAGKRGFAKISLPLISVSLFHLVGWALYRMFSQLEYPNSLLHSILDGIGLVIGLVLCALFSRKFPSRTGQMSYLVFCYVFLVGVFAAYLLYLN